jgi:hypothetical protein
MALIAAAAFFLSTGGKQPNIARPPRGGLPPYVRVESRGLDGEPFMPEGYGMTRDWPRFQRIRRRTDERELAVANLRSYQLSETQPAHAFEGIRSRV